MQRNGRLQRRKIPLSRQEGMYESDSYFLKLLFT